MTNKPALFVLLFMLLGVAYKAQAQDSDEYATVLYYRASGTPTIYVSYSNGTFQKTETDKKDDTNNMCPALKIVTDLNKQGWELVSNGGDWGQWWFTLKRKLANK